MPYNLPCNRFAGPLANCPSSELIAKRFEAVRGAFKGDEKRDNKEGGEGHVKSHRCGSTYSARRSPRVTWPFSVTFQRQENRRRWSSCIFHYDARTTGYEEPIRDPATSILASDSFRRNSSRIQWTLIVIYRFDAERISSYEKETIFLQSVFLWFSRREYVEIVRLCCSLSTFGEEDNDKLKINVTDLRNE